jgi:diguanylate cyclase (GGDEF)-like protein/PAS domain S-box-containing protein
MVVPALILLLLAGVALMRAQIRPLAARLVASENQAKEQQQEMNILVGSVAEGIITINEAGVIESFNAAASRIFGYPPNEAIGQNIKILMPEDMRARHASGMRNYLDLRRSTIVGGENIELPGLRKDGSVFTLEMTVNEIAHGTRRTFVGVVRDISDRKLVEARLLHMAQFDMLTGLPNRALFMDRLTSTAVRAKRSGSAFAVLFLDLDGFKKVNDTMGHHSGDELLQKFGERLSELVRKSDTVARFGGDEFTIILEGLLHPQADACAVADKILTAMRVPFDLADGQATVTTSIGVAVETSGESNIEELLRHADDAMYRAKSSGKGCWKN